MTILGSLSLEEFLRFTQQSGDKSLAEKKSRVVSQAL